MPEFDGFKFLISKSTNPSFSEIPVVMLTSVEDVEKKIKGLEQGASDYLTKPFNDGELLARVKVQLKIKHLQDELKEKNSRLRELSGTDELTKLANRRRFMEQFASEFSRAQRYKKELCFVILDVDFFKRVNDSFGHLAGDAALVQIGEIMFRNMRQCDLIARYGGEEFTLLLPETGLKGGIAHAERIRKDIENTGFAIGNEIVQITVSGGCAAIPETKAKSVDELVRKADEALYHAKNSGRNKIEPSR
jgi:diguanylate cyclase (GGDEF)-like protein